jgi:TatD DNase family protein
MEIIDTHCHLNDRSFAATLPDVLDRAKAASVNRILVPAYDMESLERTAQLGESYPGLIFPAYGLHPWFIEDRCELDRIHTLLIHGNPIAVGEIGLDFSSLDYPNEERQVQVLRAQLDMAAALGLPVMIHCRKAYDQLYGVLQAYRGIVQGVLHSYSGGVEGLDRFIELGFYISFSGSLTRRNARRYHRTAAVVPLERLLLETDAPSIATELTVASAVEPRQVIEVAEKVAEIRGLSLQEICRQSTENAMRLFHRIAEA